MASKNKKAKTDKKKHPGRGGNFLKEKEPNGIKKLSFYNSSERQRLKKNLNNEE